MSADWRAVAELLNYKVKVFNRQMNVIMERCSQRQGCLHPLVQQSPGLQYFAQSQNTERTKCAGTLRYFFIFLFLLLFFHSFHCCVSSPGFSQPPLVLCAVRTLGPAAWTASGRAHPDDNPNTHKPGKSHNHDQNENQALQQHSQGLEYVENSSRLKSDKENSECYEL